MAENQDLPPTSPTQLAEQQRQIYSIKFYFLNDLPARPYDMKCSQQKK
jgi:hypothetical protein